MSHHALLEYVRKAKDGGASDREISDRLYHVGWYRVDIQDALELYRKMTAPIAGQASAAVFLPSKPNLTERLVPRTYDPHVITVAALSFVIGFVGYLWLVK